MEITQQVQYIINTLEHAGYEAYIVGGCVRDIIRGAKPKDWDIASSATPVQAKALFKRVIDTGIKHGTITVLLDKKHYEVTTYRIDGQYLDGRRPETVTFTSNITSDLSRRDFTMNAIAYNPAKGFADPFNGIDDINSKIIRCVGNPIHRFTEDALRMLRAIRFAGTTGFIICNNLLEAITVLKSNLQNVSPERIREELVKLVTSQNPEAIGFLCSTGLMPYVLCGINYNGNINNVIRWLAACPVAEPLRMALFLYWSGENCKNILRALRFDNKAIKEISLYVEMLHIPLPTTRYQIKKILRLTSPALFENILTLKTITDPSQAQFINSIRQDVADIIQKGECFTLRDLAVDGNILAEMGVPRGVAMGNHIEKLLDLVMQNPELNTRQILLGVPHE